MAAVEVGVDEDAALALAYDSGDEEAREVVGHHAEREMCPWAISKYFGDWVPTQVLKCEFMLMDEQSANQEQRYVSKS
jgi:hypothetical protein